MVVGGGPTGVELAGAIGEMSRFTLAKDFRNINAALARVMLIEAGPRILPQFSEELAARATRDLEHLGVQVWTQSAVTRIDAQGVEIRGERIDAATVLWAAGVKASSLGAAAGLDVDRQGRVLVEPDLSVKGIPTSLWPATSRASCTRPASRCPARRPWPCKKDAISRGLIRDDLAGKPRLPFHFVDKGQMATIGRSRAIVEIGRLKLAGFPAWVIWLVVHIYYLTGFKNRLLVVLQWAWSYLTLSPRARLIVNKEWRLKSKCDEPANSTQ